MPKRALHEALSREFSSTQREKTANLLESAAKRSSLEGFFSDDESKDSDVSIENGKDNASETLVEPVGFLKNTSNSTYKFGKISGIEEPLSTCFITRDDAFAVLSHGLLCEFCATDSTQLPHKLVEELYVMIYKAPDRSLAEVAARAFSDIYSHHWSTWKPQFDQISTALEYFGLSISSTDCQVDENTVCGWNSWCGVICVLLGSHDKQIIQLEWTLEEMRALLLILMRLAATSFGYVWSSTALSQTISALLKCLPSDSLKNIEPIICTQQGAADCEHNLRILRIIPPLSHTTALLKRIASQCLRTMRCDIFDSVPACLKETVNDDFDAVAVITNCAKEFAESYSSSNFSLYEADYLYFVSLLDALHTALLRAYILEQGEDVLTQCKVVSDDLRKRASRNQTAFEISDKLAIMDLKWRQEQKRRKSLSESSTS